MELMPIHIDKNNLFAADYYNKQEVSRQYFHYRPFGDDKNRLAHIQKRTYKREALSEVLMKMNAAWDAPDDTMAQIERLKSPESTVVIGGQQAGLLSGPLYTVNKLISIIRLAKEKESYLNQPVLPVFWIAGEDHDFAEINHIFSIKGNKHYKHTINQRENDAKSVSDIDIDKVAAKKWLQQFLNDVPETVYTAKWYNDTICCLEKSVSYTDFFARLIFQLFPDSGVILVDAHDRALRELESSYFNLLIENQQIITDHVYHDLQKMRQQGYPILLDMELNNANLFYHDDFGSRILLERSGEQWIGKKEEVLKTTTEMYDVAKNEPWRLSTNVVTRPIMQELLFPTLAFVAGDGEISYWGTLKHAFDTLGIEVPPVVPRLSFTYITERMSKLLNRRALKAEDVIKEGISVAKQQWLLTQKNVPLDALFDEAKESMEKIHAPLNQYATSISSDLEKEADKNFSYIEQQLDYLQKRIMQKMESNYEVQLSHYDELESGLHPNGMLQERIWNPFVLINQYGYQFLKAVLQDENLSFQHNHYIVNLDK